MNGTLQKQHRSHDEANQTERLHRQFGTSPFSGYLLEYDDAGNLTRMDLFGDMNCDGVVSSSDTAAFNLAITNAAAYATTYPDCPILIGDFNGDGSVTVGDIGPYIAAVTAGGSSRVFAYDEENRLTSVTVGSLHLSMGYDAVGRRVLSTEHTGLEEPCEPPATATQVHTRHVYLGLTALEEHRKAICSDSTTVDWSLAREFLWGENFPEPVALIDWTEAGDVVAGTEEWLFYLRDVLGSVVGLVTPEDQDTSGTQSKLVERYTYDPYGKTYIDAWDQSLNSGAGGWVRVTQSEYGNPFLWTGQRYDSLGTRGFGLYHFLFRSYSPELGRWMQRDPIGYLDGPNLYQYLRGSAISLVDPFGLASDVIRHNNGSVTEHFYSDKDGDYLGSINYPPGDYDRAHNQGEEEWAEDRASQVRDGLGELASGIGAAADIAAGLHPASGWVELSTGADLRGNPLGGFDRGMAAAGIAAGIIGDMLQAGGKAARAARAIRDHMQTSDLAGAAIEASGRVVRTGNRIWDHITEVRSALEAVRSRLRQILRLIQNPRLTDKEVRKLIEEYHFLRKAENAARDALAGEHLRHCE